MLYEHVRTKHKDQQVYLSKEMEELRIPKELRRGVAGYCHVNGLLY